MPIGLHEIHVTVKAEQIALLRRYAFSHGMKPILAAAYGGQHPNQLMISAWRRGTSEDIIRQANDIADDMSRNGLVVVRIKVESMMNNEECPYVPASGCYWEYHIKIAADSDEKTVLDVARQHSAALSYSVFKPENTPLLTLRSVNCNRSRIMAYKDALEQDLEQNGLIVIGVQQEYTVYDTNPSLDDDWIVLLK